MSDVDDDGANLSTDVTPHDDIDLPAVLADLSMEAPKFDKILLAARRFSDSHRFLINKFILEPTMQRKKMNYLFAKYITTVRLNKHPEAVMRIQITPEEAKELARAIVKTINTEDGRVVKDFRPWRFVISTDEKSPDEYVTMTGNSRNSSIISEASDLTKAERALFLAIVEEMMETDGTVKMTWIHTMIQKEPHKIPGPKCDVFMTRMTRQKYFTMCIDREIVEISPRTVIELEPWLRAKFSTDLKLCQFCNKIISRPVYTSECNKCHTLCHYNCFKNATVIANQNSIECGKCQDMLSLDEVDDQLVLKRVNGVSRAPSRSASSTATATAIRSNSNDSVKQEDEDEEATGAAAAPTARAAAGAAAANGQSTVKEEIDDDEGDQPVVTKKVPALRAKKSSTARTSTAVNNKNKNRNRNRVIVDSDSD